MGSSARGNSSRMGQSTQSGADLEAAMKNGGTGAGSGILRPSTSRILINNRALMASKAEEAEYNLQQSKLKQQEEQKKIQQEQVLRQQRQQEQPREMDEYRNSLRSSDPGLAPSSNSSTARSNSRTRSSSNYSAQLQSASPIARFVSPLWAQYDSDEEEIVAEEEEAEAEAAKRAALEERAPAAAGAGISNPILMPATGPVPGITPAQAQATPRASEASTVYGLNHDHDRQRMDSAEVARQRRARRKESGEASVDDDTEGGSDYDDDSEDRDSEKYVRFGNNAVRFISTNSSRALSISSGASSLHSDPNTVELSSSVGSGSFSAAGGRDSSSSPRR